MSKSEVKIKSSWMAKCWDSKFTMFYELEDGRTLTHGQMMKAGYLSKGLNWN